MTWEYTTIQLVATGFEDGDKLDNYQRILAEYGLNGWELVSAVSYNSAVVTGHIMVLFFKRPLATE
jgi:hypothetical protein